MTVDLSQTLLSGMTDAASGWSMGSFGAIAEFNHVAGDAMPDMAAHDTVYTDRGGIRLDRLADVVPVAWEALSPRPDRWQQGISLCLPPELALMSRRSTLTELGPDTAAIRPQDRQAILFDMGLDQPQVDFCIRTSDPALLAILREYEGRSLIGHGNPAMAAILKAHPHRIALSNIGRIEVYQMIGGPDTGGVSPLGPHTHVLPRLLAAKRSHSANTPIPEGLMPVAGFHPPSAIMGLLAEDRVFSESAYQQFQSLLSVWGDEGRNAIKLRVHAALSAGKGPSCMAEPASRADRVAMRVALRQYGRLHGESDLLAAWRAVYDRATIEADEDAPGH